MSMTVQTPPIILQTPPIIFWPGPRQKALMWRIMAVFSLGFTIASAVSFRSVGLQFTSFAFAIAAITGAVAAVASLGSRTVITPEGIKKCPVFLGGFSFQWRDVDSWALGAGPFPLIAFTVRGRKVANCILGGDVDQPGFEELISAVRQYIPDRESPPIQF